ncbi:MAG: hypothetical protein ACJ79K_17215 [Gemmatimonadaceae bacterium]
MLCTSASPVRQLQATMPHDHQFIRNLLQLRDGPRVPIAWLLVPWLAVLWWSAGVARALFPGQAALDSGWVTFFTAVLGWQFLLLGGLGTAATWAWLYFAWPDHPRAFCWAAAMGLLGLAVFPSLAAAVVPLAVALCMVGAIVEQVIAVRLGARR